MRRGFANPVRKIFSLRTKENDLIPSPLITYHGVNGYLHFVREDLSYRPPVLLRTAKEKDS